MITLINIKCPHYRQLSAKYKRNFDNLPQNIVAHFLQIFFFVGGGVYANVFMLQFLMLYLGHCICQGQQQQ